MDFNSGYNCFLTPELIPSAPINKDPSYYFPFVNFTFILSETPDF
jgi:hypothetical protein